MREEKTRREKDMGTKVTLVHASPKYAALLLLKETGTKYKKKLLEELWAGFLMSGWSSGDVEKNFIILISLFSMRNLKISVFINWVCKMATEEWR